MTMNYNYTDSRRYYSNNIENRKTDENMEYASLDKGLERRNLTDEYIDEQLKKTERLKMSTMTDEEFEKYYLDLLHEIYYK
jgi:hypothetical protein